MEEKSKLFSCVLKELHKQDVLNGLIIIGSWCQYYYRILFDKAPEFPLIRTTDIDFLIPNPARFNNKVDVSDLLNKLGFDSDFDYSTGLVKYVHPDLEIQFLTPALGRVKETPYEIKKLNINAEGLSYIKRLQDYKFAMIHKDLTIWLPEPEVYVLHKILISQKRKNFIKGEKDLMAAKSIGELCLDFEARRVRLKMIFFNMPKKWQKIVLNVLKQLSSKLFFFYNESSPL